MHGFKNTPTNNKERHPLAGVPLIISLLLHIITIILLIGIWGEIKESPHRNTEIPIEVALVEQIIAPDSDDAANNQKEFFTQMKNEFPSPEKIEVIASKPPKTHLKKEERPKKTSQPETSKPQPPKEITVRTSSPDTGLIHNTSYALEVAHHISKYKFYPLAARQRHETGRLLASITLDAQGQLIVHKIEQSSGSRILDYAALKAIVQASPYPPPPMGRAEVTLKIPLNYTLDSQR
ncbi:MAG: energy transducer TonB [Pseudobdellovibrionaceae bacterium]